MCDGGYMERLYWIRRMEQLREEMEAEELKKRGRASAPVKPAEPEKGVGQEEPVPV